MDYAAAYQNPEGPGDARPTASHVLQDQGLAGTQHLAGRAALITGCSGGIGAELAKALHSLGADVYITVRNETKGCAVAADIQRTQPGFGKVVVLHLECASLQSVRDCAAVFLRQRSDLTLLVCNAGVMMCPEGRTVDGIETHFQVNFLAHWLLFDLLRPALLAGCTTQLYSRVVNLASSGHRWQPVLLDDYNLEHKGYDAGMAYGQSKTAQCWMSNEIERLYGSQGLHGLSCHPGTVMTDLGRHMDKEALEWWTQPHVMARFQSAAQGAASPTWACVARELEGKGGLYIEECRVGQPVEAKAQIYEPGYAPHAFDEAGQRALWALAERLTKQ